MWGNLMLRPHSALLLEKRHNTNFPLTFVGPVDGDGVLVALVVIVVVVPLVVHVVLVLAVYILDVLGPQAADVVEAHLGTGLIIHSFLFIQDSLKQTQE